jgi:hypothetical protein
MADSTLTAPDSTKQISKTLTDQNINDTANLLGIEPACIKAVLTVESKGKGFLDNGMPIILFEGHIFWSQLKKLNIDPNTIVKGNEDILYPKWTKQFYKGGVQEYNRLNRAKAINEIAALSSTSWGLFQIMGFNFKTCGFTDVKSYVNSMYISELEQLKAFGCFIKASGWIGKLQNKDWAGFAKCYNGPDYAQNQYDIKLQNAYNKFKA